MDKIVTDKSILVGDEKLVKKNKWISLTEMNTDFKILSHKLFDDCFNKILKLHKPKHKIAFISLCTSTRPYHLGRKWKYFKTQFGSNVDLIVVSSGGIIPEEFWDSYPYLNYDGDSAKSANELYSLKMETRLLKFFKTHHYDYVVVNLRPKLRNTPVAEQVFSKLKKINVINDYIIIPNQELYEDIQKRGFPRGKVFPDLDDKVIEHLSEKINMFNSQ